MEKIIAFVHEVHKDHTYGDKPYTHHLNAVELVLADAGMTSEDDRIIAQSHDSIEDATEDQRPAVIDFHRTHMSAHAFAVVWALSGIGPNRKARNADAYAKIAAYPEAANYKVADRIANMESAAVWQPRLYAMYLKESEAFYENVVKLATNQALVERYRVIAQMT